MTIFTKSYCLIFLTSTQSFLRYINSKIHRFLAWPGCIFLHRMRAITFSATHTVLARSALYFALD